ncbi:unnamed protein product [Rotaria socialis]|uniref:Mos1 transposase HTH domain-containing protein n=1 Tax=Rotaria socialis TaxID=392032 RepID=A0A818F3P4_9BILA|nr:unnamed protein product [Rotaria socialis]
MGADHELKMDLSRREIRVLLLHEFRMGRKATEAANNICSTMGEDILSIRTAQHWFNRFKNGDLELDDLPRPGKPLKVDVDLLKQLIEQDPRLTSRCLVEQLGCSHTAVEKHLNELDKKWRYGVWIPHELSPHQLQHRVDACVATPKADLHPKKVMLSVWSGVNGIIHWELLPNGCTITAELYYQQLDRVAEKLKGKQDRIYYLHDNAKPHVAKSAYEKLLKLGWITIPYPPYSPDLAPADYHLFRSLYHHLREKNFDDENDVKMDIINFFGQKSQDFYESGILSLPERRRQVIDSSGAYISES